MKVNNYQSALLILAVVSTAILLYEFWLRERKRNYV